MKAEEEMRQMAIAHDLFCELNPKSKDTAISILRLLLVEETRPFGQYTPPTVADVSQSQKPTTSNKKRTPSFNGGVHNYFLMGSETNAIYATSQ